MTRKTEYWIDGDNGDDVKHDGSKQKPFRLFERLFGHNGPLRFTSEDYTGRPTTVFVLSREDPVTENWDGENRLLSCAHRVNTSSILAANVRIVGIGWPKLWNEFQRDGVWHPCCTMSIGSTYRDGFNAHGVEVTGCVIEGQHNGIHVIRSKHVKLVNNDVVNDVGALDERYPNQPHWVGSHIAFDKGSRYCLAERNRLHEGDHVPKAIAFGSYAAENERTVECISRCNEIWRPYWGLFFGDYATKCVSRGDKVFEFKPTPVARKAQWESGAEFCEVC